MRFARFGLLRLAAITAVALALATAMTSAAEAGTAVPPATRAATAAHPARVFTAFRGFGFRSRSYGYRYGYGYGRGYRYGYGRRSPSLLHRVVKTAAWLYILHLFFTHGGLSIVLWIIIIGLVVSLVRRRRRRYAYRAQGWP